MNMVQTTIYPLQDIFLLINNFYLIRKTLCSKSFQNNCFHFLGLVSRVKLIPFRSNKKRTKTFLLNQLTFEISGEGRDRVRTKPEKKIILERYASEREYICILTLSNSMTFIWKRKPTWSSDIRFKPYQQPFFRSFSKGSPSKMDSKYEMVLIV